VAYGNSNRSDGHKGFGLAFLVEVPAGVLAGSGFGRTELTESPLRGRERVANGYLFLQLDVSRFQPLPESRSRVDARVRDVRSCAPAEGVERVLVPGELEARRPAERLCSGIPPSGALLQQLEATGSELVVAALARIEEP
jgi:LDH2 family malate/lactate/ureidoglycolate dehydrogenase